MVVLLCRNYKSTRYAAFFQSLKHQIQLYLPLVEADRILVYGYSFPSADAQSRTFFLRASASMVARPVLISINPDISSAPQAEELFRPRAHMFCGSVRDYLSEAGNFLYQIEVLSHMVDRCHAPGW